MSTLPSFRLTLSGRPISTRAHLEIWSTADGSTVTFCRICREGYRQGWPGLLWECEDWARDHQHVLEAAARELGYGGDQ